MKLAFLRDEKLISNADSIPRILDELDLEVLILNRGAWYEADHILKNGWRQVLDHLLANFTYYKDDQTSIPNYQQQRQKKLIIRTTVPGHPNCEKYTKPSYNITEMEAIISNISNYNTGGKNTHWWDFQNQNKLVEGLIIWKLQNYQHEQLVKQQFNRQGQLLRKLPFSIRILDACHINMLRPDQHLVSSSEQQEQKEGQGGVNDCLHSCFPGKIDVYSQMLLHMLTSWDTF